MAGVTILSVALELKTASSMASVANNTVMRAIKFIRIILANTIQGQSLIIILRH